jgi:YafQ family addiction module toxin component
MYSYEIKPYLKKILGKIAKKDKQTYEQILKKIKEVITSGDVEHYKNLRNDFKEFKRVHIGHFVLVFKFDKTNNLISFENFDHHDRIYK